MFCSSCGAVNADGAVFCSKCGAALARTPASSIPAPVPPAETAPTSSGLPPGGRNPWIAAVLNFFFGIGYLYLGYNRVQGVPTILFIVVMLVLEVIAGVFTFGLFSLFIAIFLAYDGFVKAKGQRGYLNTKPGIGYQP